MKHDFVFPRISCQIFCRDYCSKEDGLKTLFNEKLDKNTLYYYAHTQLPYWKFDSFDKIQSLVIGIWLKKSDKYFIIGNDILKTYNENFIVEIPDYYNCYLPSSGAEILLKIGVNNLSTAVCNSNLRYKSKVLDKLILVPNPKNSIYDWLSYHFDMPLIIQKITDDYLLSLDDGFHAFLKIDKPKKCYTLIPDYLFFEELYGFACSRNYK